jgi:hypothetical protein
MMIHFLRPVILATLLSLSACVTTSVQSDVARFHRLAAPSGETFRLVPSEAAKAASLEFDSYAKQVADQLVRVGFRAADAGTTATYEVQLDYGISGGKEKLATRPGLGTSLYARSAFSGYHYRGAWIARPYYHPFYDPFFHDSFSEPEVYSYTVYTRSLKMDIKRSSDGEKLFEGRVESIGTDKRLPEVMPYLVEALFTGFPGNSGTTQTIKVPVKRN